jgi:hypothetical protein
VKIFTSKLQWSLKIPWSRAPFLFERELLIKFSPKSQNFQTTIFQMRWVVQRQPELKTPAQSATHHTVQIALKKFLQSHALRTVQYRTRSIRQKGFLNISHEKTWNSYALREVQPGFLYPRFATLISASLFLKIFSARALSPPSDYGALGSSVAAKVENSSTIHNPSHRANCFSKKATLCRQT